MKIALLGYGKMGKAIAQVVAEQYANCHEIVLCIDSKNRGEIGVSSLQMADVVIEFSRPEAVFDNLMLCFAARVPVVCGTTGWQHLYLDNIKEICETQGQALLHAANFSVGVQIFLALNRYLAGLMKNQTEYALQIDEIHHTQKLDAPSGTALLLAGDIMAQNPHKHSWINHESSQNDQIPILSHRQPDVKGTHIVRYTSPIDSLEISHVAHSRQGFAQGAVIAAEWLQGKKGVFTMRDVLAL